MPLRNKDGTLSPRKEIHNDPRGFTEHVPMEQGAGGSRPKAVSGGRYAEFPSTLRSSGPRSPPPPFRNLRDSPRDGEPSRGSTGPSRPPGEARERRGLDGVHPHRGPRPW